MTTESKTVRQQYLDEHFPKPVPRAELVPGPFAEQVLNLFRVPLPIDLGQAGRRYLVIHAMELSEDATELFVAYLREVDLSFIKKMYFGLAICGWTYFAVLLKFKKPTAYERIHFKFLLLDELPADGLHRPELGHMNEPIVGKRGAIYWFSFSARYSLERNLKELRKFINENELE